MLRLAQEKPKITRAECKRLVRQADFLGGTPYVLFRVGPLRGGIDVFWRIETAQHAMKAMGRSDTLIEEGYTQNY